MASTLLITSLVDAHSVRTVQLDGEEGGLIHEMTTPIKKCVEVKLSVSSLSGPALRNVTVCVNCALPLTTHPSHFTLPEVSSTQDHTPIVLTVVATPTLLPTSTHLTLSATYTSNEGIPHVHIPSCIYHSLQDCLRLLNMRWNYQWNYSVSQLSQTRQPLTK